MNRKFVCLAMICLLALSVFAPAAFAAGDAADFTVFFRDSDGNPLAGVTCTLDSDNPDKQEQVTDAEGGASFRGLAFGRHELTLSNGGEDTPGSITVVLEPGDSAGITDLDMNACTLQTPADTALFALFVSEGNGKLAPVAAAATKEALFGAQPTAQPTQSPGQTPTAQPTATQEPAPTAQRTISVQLRVYTQNAPASGQFAIDSAKAQPGEDGIAVYTGITLTQHNLFVYQDDAQAASCSIRLSEGQATGIQHAAMSQYDITLSAAAQTLYLDAEYADDGVLQLISASENGFSQKVAPAEAGKINITLDVMDENAQPLAQKAFSITPDGQDAAEVLTTDDFGRVVFANYDLAAYTFHGAFFEGIDSTLHISLTAGDKTALSDGSMGSYAITVLADKPLYIQVLAHPDGTMEIKGVSDAIPVQTLSGGGLPVFAWALIGIGIIIAVIIIIVLAVKHSKKKKSNPPDSKPRQEPSARSSRYDHF